MGNGKKIDAENGAFPAFSSYQLMMAFDAFIDGYNCGYKAGLIAARAGK